MRYFKAVPTDEKPFVHFAGWADSLAELTEMGEFENPLIVAEDQIVYQFGVFTMRIVDGALVDWTPEEMDTFEAEYNQKQLVSAESAKVGVIDNEKFVYSSKSYPLHPAARLRYMAIEADNGKDVQVMTITGEIVTVAEANIPAFMNAYYTKLYNLTNY